ncbi:DUF1800 domain-containing protein [Sphingomonas alpina]|uniref:DUF1800 domain-containing protein n=1 Tax=Sphingomonas alpina TaxID=653931 RepID=A0A7H0LLH9_9SPHN|nr:DUF1800 domain-containing protein [Sphingomonas alpina]QNQ10532.1 DUF1800 domain-containing protein [Sphingomonas alpina]
MSQASIALNRFGLGARADDVVPEQPVKYLLEQFDRYEARPVAIAAMPGRRQVAGELADYLIEARQLRAMSGPRRALPANRAAAMTAQSQVMMTGYNPAKIDSAADKMEGDSKDPIKQARQFAQRQGRDNYVAAVGGRALASLTGPAPFVERLVHFWANHFAVSADKLTVIGLSGLLEFEAIRPHVLGKFGDMLAAVERHPAMLLYLDQAESIGPNSPIGSRYANRPNRKLGLNENLAREILELHTLGVRTGYSQADVTELARALTGWTVAGLTNGPVARAVGVDDTPGDFVFVEQIHEPGTRTIIGKSYAQDGERQAQAVLSGLATHPATATHIATKLARHFTGDTPAPALVARLEAAFLKSGGDLPTVYRALIAAPEAWAERNSKFKSPWEWSVSVMRALDMKTVQPQAVTGLLNQLGQPIWRPGSPAGYDDINAGWAGPDAVMRRVEAAERFATRAGGSIDARALAPKLFPAAVGAATTQALARAESPGQALALLLVAPEFMRR